jgi:predicted transcriptional regulator
VAYFDNIGDGPDRGAPDGGGSKAVSAGTPQRALVGNGSDAEALAALLAGTDPAAAALPQQAILSAAVQHNYNPVRMARDLGIRIDSAFFLLAHLPRGPKMPIFGIIRCDGSGGVRYRRELEGLSLPKYASACPLWPIYRAFGQPDQPVRAIIETPIGDRFLTYSFATYTGGADFGLPGLLRSTMAYTNDKALLASARVGTWQEPIPVGLQCAICPRAECRARREHYILDRPDAERRGDLS